MNAHIDRGAWIANLRKLRGSALWSAIEGRLVRSEGPPLNDREMEAPETAVVEAGDLDDVLRAQLNLVVSEYFMSDPDPRDAKALLLARGALEIVRRLSLYGASPAVRAWLSSRQEALTANFGLASAALQALAASQSPAKNVREFWIKMATTGPASWLPASFASLRMIAPRDAVEQLPATLKRLHENNIDAMPLLRALWKDRNAREQLVAWAGANQQSSQEVVQALVAALPKERQSIMAVAGRPPVFGRTGNRITPIGGVAAPSLK